MPRRNRQSSSVSESRTGIRRRDARTELFRKAQRETLAAVAAVLDHQSRNLLGALNTCVRMLGRNAHITPEDRELLDMIESGSRRLQETVSEFGAFANPRPPRFEPVDLALLIDRTLRQLERDKRWSSALVVKRAFDPAVAAVLGDAEQLGQVLQHLFVNAVQAMEGQGELEVQTERYGANIRIVVRDTGPGIPAAVLPNIFEPLFTTKSRGTGLGLAIAQQIVASHGGEVAVQSNGEGGNAFVVTLPHELGGT